SSAPPLGRALLTSWSSLVCPRREPLLVSVRLPGSAVRLISSQRDVGEHRCLAKVLRELWQVRLLRSRLWFDRKFCKSWLQDGSVHHSKNRPFRAVPRNGRKRSNQANSRTDIAGKA